MSKHIKSLALILLAGLLLAACAPKQTVTPIPETSSFSPQPGDETMNRGEVEIVSVVFLTSPGVSVSFSYRLPTPCYQLRVGISQPDSQNRIQLEIYAVTPKDKPCNLMALSTPQETTISLGSLPAGHYSAWINGQQVGEFDAK